MTKVKDVLLKTERQQEKEGKANLEEDIEKHNIEVEKSKTNQKKRDKKRHTVVHVDGLEGIYVRFAKCCNPLPGDDIVGYITRGRGVTVHRVDCENLIRDKEKDCSRMVEVSWVEDNNSRFEAEIEVSALDRRGMVNEITHVINNEKISLTGIYARKGHELGINVFLILEVNGKEQLNDIMKKIKNIPGVETARRVKGR